MKPSITVACFLLVGIAFGQQVQITKTKAGPSSGTIASSKGIQSRIGSNGISGNQKALDSQIDEIDKDGIQVPIQTIAHYRGMRKFQLAGVGLVIGLQGTGDSKKSVMTQIMYSNYLKKLGVTVPSSQIQAANAALVQVTTDLDAFSKPGTLIDCTVSSISDATSLQGGTLVMTPMYGPTDQSEVIASAQGPISIGGFSSQGNGSSVQRNHLNVGRIPSGAEIQSRIESQVVFNSGDKQVLYLDLDQPNPTTVSRIVHALQDKYPMYEAGEVDSTTIRIEIPTGADPMDVMSSIDQMNVYADIPAKVVINERTGTIVVGGNVKLGPAMIVTGGLNIRIDTTNDVSQPAPFSNGTTTPVSNSNVNAAQETSKVALLPPTTTVSDLARIFQALRLKPNDVIQILQALKTQGALKAEIELQ